MDLLADLALGVLSQPDPADKVAASRISSARWLEKRTSQSRVVGTRLPDRPARPEKPSLVAPRDVPKRKIGSAQGRIALLHALAHIELNAIDLAFDMAGRFAAECERRFGSAEEFISDWFVIGAEEADHFEVLEDRLNELGSHYGAMNAHDGLWQAAFDTRNNWPARLAVVPMVLEARGLDVTPSTIAGFIKQGDHKTAEILEKIYIDEIGHVKIGVKWFGRICQSDGVNAEKTFRRLVAKHFKGQIKPPFNDKARMRAGLLPNFYVTGTQ